MKIVKFKNGKYALRRFSLFGWEYMDLRDNEDYWWYRSSAPYLNCLSNNLTEITAIYNRLTDKGEPL